MWVERNRPDVELVDWLSVNFLWLEVIFKDYCIFSNSLNYGIGVLPHQVLMEETKLPSGVATRRKKPLTRYCNICKREVKNIGQAYRNHVRRHPKCPGCPLQFSNRDELHTHAPKCQARFVPTTRCEICKGGFFTTADHATHGGKCTVCSKRFRKMGRRLVSKHAQCTCKRRFLNANAMEQHLRDRQMTCNLCEESFSSCMLHHHLDTKHPRSDEEKRSTSVTKTACIMHGCKYRVTSREKLIAHLDVVHRCLECNQYFPSLDDHRVARHSSTSSTGSGGGAGGAGGMARGKWMTVKCAVHKEESVTRETIRDCPDCRVFPIRS